MMNIYEKVLSYMRKKDLSHFAKKAAIKILERFPDRDKYILEAGFTPSGKVHLGNFGDILITESVRKILNIWGYDAESILAIDSQDPFRKPPIFLPEDFKKNIDSFIGQPLETLPDPWGCHKNYVEHFVEPLINVLPDYGLEPKIVFADEIHQDKRYIELLRKIIINRKEIIRIFNSVHEKAGHTKRYPPDWIPFRPRCHACGRSDEKVRAIEVSEDGYKIRYICGHCGNEGIVDIRKAEGKAPWRIDWPLRWILFNVNFEPMGKDLMAAGSSYDTSKALLKEFFGREPPVTIFYDFFYWALPDKEPKKFSKRSGVGMGAHEWLSYAEPQILNYLLLKRHIGDIEMDSLRHIYFNPLDIPTYVERYDNDEEYLWSILNKKHLESEDLKMLVAFYLSQPNPSEAFKVKLRRVPYDLAVRVAIWMDNIDDGLNMLKQAKGLPKDATPEDIEDAKRRLLYAKNYVRDWWKPPTVDVKKILDTFDSTLKSCILELLEATLNIKPEELSQKALSTIIKDLSNKYNIKPRQIFRALYRITLGENTGPAAYRLFRREFSRNNLIRAYEILRNQK